MVTSDTKIRLIQQLRNQGFKVRDVAKELKVSTDSVIKYSSKKSAASPPTRVERVYTQQSGAQVKPLTEKIQIQSELENIRKLKQQILQEKENQKNKQRIQELSKKVDRLIKSTRENHEFEKKLNEIREIKLASDQNKKIESDNINKISTTNHDNIGSILHVEEQQKIESLEEQKKITNHESTYTDKNISIHDHESTISDDMVLTSFAKSFEGLSPAIGGFIGEELKKVKHNINPPKKVTLIPLKKVNLREVKKEEEG